MDQPEQMMATARAAVLEGESPWGAVMFAVVRDESGGLIVRSLMAGPPDSGDLLIQVVREAICSVNQPTPRMVSWDGYL